MKLLELVSLSPSEIILEGGAAIKGVDKINQVEARHLIPEIIEKISKKLGISAKKVKATGSGGKKADDSALSGDIDLAIEAPARKIEQACMDLAHDNMYRIMKGINCYSFATKFNGKLVQIDMIPVEDVNYAEWSYQANEQDLKKGLKGAHRNELFFAVCKHADRHVLRKDDDGDPAEVERYFYDLSKGLMTGKQSRVNKKGRIVKNWTTTDKHVVTKDPNQIAKILFGSTAEKCATFKGCLAAIHGPKFPFPKLRDKVIETARKGIKSKGLAAPEGL